MDVSVILVNYNTLQLTADCIRSIRKQTRGVEYEIIIVDNASTDGSKDYFQKDKGLKYIYSETNHGFGIANNIGVDYAKGKYVLFLNTDTLLENNMINTMFHFLENSPYHIVGCGCILTDIESKPMHSYGWFPTIFSELLYFIRCCRKKENLQMDNASRKVDYITGADLFMRKDAFLNIGRFDSNIFMYYEETDLQKRLHDVGFEIHLLGITGITHLEGGSFSSKSGVPLKRLEMQLDSRLYYLKKHNGPIKYTLFRIAYALEAVLPVVLLKCPVKKKLKYLSKYFS